MGYLLSPYPTFRTGGAGTAGEQAFIGTLRRCLPDDWLIWSPGRTGTHSDTCIPDAVLFHPSHGILVVEVKEWSKGGFVVTEQGKVRVVGGHIEDPPDQQAFSYQRKIVRDLTRIPELQQQEGAHKGKLCMRYDHLVALPHLEEADAIEYREQNSELFSPERTIFKEHLQAFFLRSKEENEKYLCEFFRISANAFRHEKLSLAQILRLHEYFHPEKVTNYRQLPAPLFHEVVKSGWVSVSGPASSGKTSLLVEWVRDRAKNATPKNPVVVVAYYRAARNELREALKGVSCVEIEFAKSFRKREARDYWAVAVDQLDAFAGEIEEILRKCPSISKEMLFCWDSLSPAASFLEQGVKTKAWQDLAGLSHKYHYQRPRYNGYQPAFFLLQRAFANQFLGRSLKPTDDYTLDEKKRLIRYCENGGLCRLLNNDAEELDLIKKCVDTWVNVAGIPPYEIAIVVPSGECVAMYEREFLSFSIPVVNIGDSEGYQRWQSKRDAVALATGSQLYGLQFEAVAVARVGLMDSRKEFEGERLYRAISRGKNQLLVTGALQNGADPVGRPFIDFFCDVEGMLAAAGVVESELVSGEVVRGGDVDGAVGGDAVGERGERWEEVVGEHRYESDDVVASRFAKETQRVDFEEDLLAADVGLSEESSQPFWESEESVVGGGERWDRDVGERRWASDDVVASMFSKEAQRVDFEEDQLAADVGLGEESSQPFWESEESVVGGGDRWDRDVGEHRYESDGVVASRFAKETRRVDFEEDHLAAYVGLGEDRSHPYAGSRWEDYITPPPYVEPDLPFQQDHPFANPHPYTEPAAPVEPQRIVEFVRVPVPIPVPIYVTEEPRDRDPRVFENEYQTEYHPTVPMRALQPRSVDETLPQPTQQPLKRGGNLKIFKSMILCIAFFAVWWVMAKLAYTLFYEGWTELQPKQVVVGPDE